MTDPIHQQAMVASISDLFHASKYYDLTIRCGSEVWRVHRAIVCQRSQFFAAACDSDFKEAHTATINLDDDDPPTMKRMLTYMYTLDYDDEGEAASTRCYLSNGDQDTEAGTPELPIEGDATRHGKLMNNVLVYAVADKYDVPELKCMALSKFNTLMQGAGLCGNLPTIVDAVFGTTPSADLGLRSVITTLCTSHARELLADESFGIMLEHHWDLGISVFRATLHQHDADLKLVRAQADTAVALERAKKQRFLSEVSDVSSMLGALSMRANELHIPKENSSASKFADAHDRADVIRRHIRSIRSSVSALSQALME